MVRSLGHFKPRYNVFSTFWVKALSKVRRKTDSSLKCLGQPAQSLLDSAVRAVHPADIIKKLVQQVVALSLFGLAVRR